MADLFIQYLYLYLLDRISISILEHWEGGQANWDDGISIKHSL